MPTLALAWDFRVTMADGEHVFASPSSPPTIALSQLKRGVLTIATATTAILWDPTLASVPTEPTSFDFLYIIASHPCFLELTANEDDPGERNFVVPLAANIPFVLGADDAWYGFTLLTDPFVTGAADVIDRLRVRNQSGSTATVSYGIGKT